MKLETCHCGSRALDALFSLLQAPACPHTCTYIKNKDYSFLRSQWFPYKILNMEISLQGIPVILNLPESLSL